MTSAGVLVWDAATGRRLGRVTAGPGDELHLVGFHPGGDVFVGCRSADGGMGGLFRVDPAAGAVRSGWRPAGRRSFASISPDGRAVYSSDNDNVSVADTVANDPGTGREFWRRRRSETGAIMPSPDGSRLLVWPNRTRWTAEVLDAATGRTVRTLSQPDDKHFPATGGVSVGPQADRVAVAHSWGRGVSVFAAGPGPDRRVPGNWVDQVFLRPDGRHAVTTRGRGNYTVEVWDLADGKCVSSAATDLHGRAALSSDGKTLAVDGVVRFADPDTGKSAPQSAPPFTQAARVWYLADGRLASADEPFASPVVWDEPRGTSAPLPGGSRPPPAAVPPTFRPPAGTSVVAVSPAGDRVVASRNDPDEDDREIGDTYLGLFDAAGRVVARYPRFGYTPAGPVAAFAADGKSFAVARGDGTVTVFDAATAVARQTFRHCGPATGVAVARDGKRVAVACPDGPILVFGVDR